MWRRIMESKLVLKQGMAPIRVVLDKDPLREEYRTCLETVHRDGEVTFRHGKIFEDAAEAHDDFERRLQRIKRSGSLCYLGK